ncbi:MAG: GNAT family N-acetyltransferase [Burkholderiales bacterium]
MSAIVRTLTEADRPAVLRHLTRLPPEDRRLRFGRSMNPLALKRYLSSIHFDADRAFGVFDADMTLIGFAHLALSSDASFAELGLSVLSESRRQGHGESLLRRAALHASNLGIRVIHMYCLRENEAIMRLARKAGFNVVPEGIEAAATKPIATGSFASLGQEALCDQIALVDQIYKRQARKISRLVSFERLFVNVRRLLRARRQLQH